MASLAKTIPESLVRAYLGPAWGIDPDATMTLLPGGVLSAAWKIEEGDSEWIAKIFDPGEDVGKIRDEFEFCDFLIERGIHVPKIKIGRNKDRLGFIPYGSETFPLTIMKFERLRKLSALTVTREEVLTIARSLAHMHQALRQYPHVDFLKGFQPEDDLRPEAYKAPQTLAAFLGTVNAMPPEDKARFAEIERRMVAFIHSHSAWSAQTETIIHGDLAFEHAQLLPDGSVYFLDLADRMWSTVAREIGTFMERIYQCEDFSPERWDELFDWFLEGYQAITPLSENDRAALSRMVLMQILGSGYYLAQVYTNTKNDGLLSWVRRGYRLGEYICQRTF